MRWVRELIDCLSSVFHDSIRGPLILVFGFAIFFETRSVVNNHFGLLPICKEESRIQEPTSEHNPDSVYINNPKIGSVEISLLDGTVYYHGNVTMDNAGYLFWQAVENAFPEERERMCEHWVFPDRKLKGLIEKHCSKLFKHD